MKGSFKMSSVEKKYKVGDYVIASIGMAGYYGQITNVWEKLHIENGYEIPMYDVKQLLNDKSHIVGVYEDVIEPMEEEMIREFILGKQNV